MAGEEIAADYTVGGGGGGGGAAVALCSCLSNYH